MGDAFDRVAAANTGDAFDRVAAQQDKGEDIEAPQEDAFDRVARVAKVPKKKTKQNYTLDELMTFNWDEQMKRADRELRGAVKLVEEQRPAREAEMAEAKASGLVIGSSQAESALEEATKRYQQLEKDVPKIARERRQYESKWDEFKVGLAKGTLETVGHAAGFLERNDAGAIWEEGSMDLIHDRMMELAGTKTLEAGEGATFGGKMAGMAGQSAPFMVGTALSTAAAGPVGGYSYAFSIINQQTYDSSIARGNTHETANNEAFVVASIAAGLEQIGMDKIFKFTGGAGKAGVKAIADAAKQRSLAKLAAGGKMSAGALGTATSEALTETLQELTAIAGEVGIGKDKVSYKEGLSRLKESAIGGFVLGGAMGLGGAAVKAVAETDTKVSKQEETATENVEVVRDAVESVKAETPTTTPEVTEQQAGVDTSTVVTTPETTPEGSPPYDTILKNNPDIGLLVSRIKEAEMRQETGRVNVLKKRLAKKVSEVEKKMAVDTLRDTVKRIDPKRMLPQHAQLAQNLIDSFRLTNKSVGETMSSGDLVELAQDVLASEPEGSATAREAQDVLNMLADKRSRTVGVRSMSTQAINQINDMLVSLEVTNVAERSEAQVARAEGIAETQKDIAHTTPQRAEGGKIKDAVRWLRDLNANMETTLDNMSGGRFGTFKDWIMSEDSPLRRPYNILQAGEGRRFKHKDATRVVRKAIMSKYNVTSREVDSWSKQRSTEVVIDGKTYTLTVAEMMHIYGMSQSKTGSSAIRADGFEGKKGRGKMVIESIDNVGIDAISDKLTDRQKRIVDETISQIYVGLHQTEMNKVSVDYDGYAIATEQDYYPMERSMPTELVGEATGVKQILVENTGIIQQRIGNGIPLKLQGFFDVLGKNTEATAKYVGLYGSLHDAKAIFDPTTLRLLEDRGYGREVQTLKKLIEQYEGQTEQQTDIEKFGRKLLANFAKSQLFAKPYLAIRQYVSTMLLGAYVKNKYMLAAKPVSGLFQDSDAEVAEEINQTSPMGAERLSNAPLARAIADVDQSHGKLGQATVDGSRFWDLDTLATMMKYFDKKAILDTFRIAKAEIQGETDTDLQTPEGREMLKNRFEYLMRNTQPMWGPLNRSVIGGSKSLALRSVTMFMSAREQIVRMTMNSITAYAGSQKTNADKAKLAKAIGTVMASTAVFTSMNMVFFSLVLGYGDNEDEDKKAYTKFLEQYAKDLGSMPFFGKWAVSSLDHIAKAAGSGKTEYKPDMPSGPIESIVEKIGFDAAPKFAKSFHKFLDGEEWQKDMMAATDDMLQGVAGATGIPYVGPKRWLGGIVRHTKKLTGTFEDESTEKDWRRK